MRGLFEAANSDGGTSKQVFDDGWPRDRFPIFGKTGTAERYGPEFFGRIGRKGGKAVSEKYGAGHFERIGRRGGQKVASLVERAKTLESEDDHEKPAPEVRPEESIGA